MLDVSSLRELPPERLLESLRRESAANEIANWLGAVQLLTNRAYREFAQYSADDQAYFAEAYETVLTVGEAVGSLDRFDCVVRRLSLTAALLRVASPRPDVLLLDPARAASLFLTEVSDSLEKVATAAAKWKSLKIDEIRRLRLIKILLAPMRGIEPFMPEGAARLEVHEWIKIHDRLP